MSARVLLASFRLARMAESRGFQPFSVARWQPGGTEWPELGFLGATYNDGRPLRLRDFPAPIVGYCAAYEDKLVGRWEEVRRWFQMLVGDVALCCWCPYSSVGRRQLAAHGTFFCHAVLLGEFLRVARPDVRVIYDFDRQTRAWRCAGPWWSEELAGLLDEADKSLTRRVGPR